MSTCLVFFFQFFYSLFWEIIHSTTTEKWKIRCLSTLTSHIRSHTKQLNKLMLIICIFFFFFFHRIEALTHSVCLCMYKKELCSTNFYNSFFSTCANEETTIKTRWKYKKKRPKIIIVAFEKKKRKQKKSQTIQINQRKNKN